MLTLDHYITDLLEPLAPYNGVLDPNNHRKLSNNIEMPTPVLETISEWLYQFDDYRPINEDELFADVA